MVATTLSSSRRSGGGRWTAEGQTCSMTLPGGVGIQVSCREAYDLELEAQEASTQRALEAAKRCMAELRGLEAETSTVARAAREDSLAFEEATAHLVLVRGAAQTLAAEKKELCRRIQAATLALGAKEAKAKAAAVADAASSMCEDCSPDSAVGRLRFLKTLKRSLLELGDEHAGLSEEVAAEQDRRARCKEAIREELERKEQECDQLQQSLEAGSRGMAQLKERLAAVQADERSTRTETSELQRHLAELRSQSPRRGSERDGLRQQLRGLAAVDLELRDKLKEAQDSLWQQERREREG